MEHWAEAYVGRSYVDGVADCASLVRAVLLDRAGVDIGPTPDGSRWRRLDTGAVKTAHGSAFHKVEKPTEGDVALLRLSGDRRTLGSHVGVVIVAGGRRRLLHALKRLGSVVTPESDLRALGLEVTGYYRVKRGEE